ncbi:MAG TPA: 16S rRNA (cytosine(1402)-N(4))-methyltransferase, partial [Candidatus Jacksonbacteria bacterium]|nr:16S rRNA (cytosine(1402)-N(4))-methyltransferase [Candidatus Jacksonbacteria bacterium]
MYFHLPVLANEVITLLQLQSNYNVLDCTLGDGGHAIELLKHTAPHGKVLGIDADAEAIERAA